MPKRKRDSLYPQEHSQQPNPEEQEIEIIAAKLFYLLNSNSENEHKVNMLGNLLERVEKIRNANLSRINQNPKTTIVHCVLLAGISLFSTNAVDRIEFKQQAVNLCVSLLNDPNNSHNPLVIQLKNGMQNRVINAQAASSMVNLTEDKEENSPIPLPIFTNNLALTQNANPLDVSHSQANEGLYQTWTEMRQAMQQRGINLSSFEATKFLLTANRASMFYTAHNVNANVIPISLPQTGFNPSRSNP